jgi:anti-anti-sigma regulatory factor
MAMLRIQRSENGDAVFTLSGQMDDEPIAELETLINSEANGRRIVLDLKNLTLVNENAITFLVGCEANSITLKNCPAYVREWINAQRREE